MSGEQPVLVVHTVANHDKAKYATTARSQARSRQ